MALSAEEREMAIRIIKRMLSKGVIKKHHKQPQTIAGWFATHERGEVKQTISAMATDPDVPLREKGRGTVTLTDRQQAKTYLTNHGADPPQEW
jgi:hypothetical protein